MPYEILCFFDLESKSDGLALLGSCDAGKLVALMSPSEIWDKISLSNDLVIMVLKERNILAQNECALVVNMMKAEDIFC